MRIGDRVQIRPSFDLIEMRLMPLSFLYGVVVEVVIGRSGEVIGCWVELEKEPYLEEKEWYIPIISLQNE